MFELPVLKRGASTLPAGELVAYFCAEYGLGDNLPIYSGGLGVLAGDLLKEAAAGNYPFVGVGLFYKKGFFHQHLDQEGQHEYVKQIDPHTVPLELITDDRGETLLIEVPINERTVYAQIWRYHIGSLSLYLLDTDHWRNSEMDRAITDQLYAGGPDKRIQQEIVLGIGGYRALERLGIKPTLYHLNEGHSAFLSLELIRKYLQSEAELETAIELAREQILFTNHTLIAAGNDTFQHTQLRYFLGKYAFDSGIGIEKLLDLGNLASQPGVFSMTTLALTMAVRSNAVSRLHAEKALAIWPDHPLIPITNGVHLMSWVAPDLQIIWDRYIPRWRQKGAVEDSWENIRRLPVQVLWNAHQNLKERMLQEVARHTEIMLNKEVLTVVWARRFTAYKRPDLLFKDLIRLKKLLFSSDRPIQIIVSGKSHPNDVEGKNIIEEIMQWSATELQHRAVFLDDYSISLAKLLVAGADLWLNTPIYGLEASGTSGMKAAANGVLQCTTPDGWAHEVDWYGMGFVLPPEGEAKDLYDLLEDKILPLYYRQDHRGLPERWVAMMRESIAELSPEFSSQRMLNDYIDRLYRPN